jgi:CRP-like cAMP-binding protein
MTWEGYNVEDAILLSIPLRTFRKAMESDAGVASKLLAAVARRRAEAEDQIERLLFRNVESRIAELILSLATPYGRPDPRGTLITMKVTHAEVSRTVGSTRETVTLTLGALKRRGLIDFDRRRIVVRDADRLRQLV